MKGTLAGEKRTASAVAASLGSYVIWGSGHLFTRSALNSVQPFLLLAVRFTVALITICVIALFRRERLFPKGKSLKPLVLFGVLEPLTLITESYGILYTNASFAGTITALVPVFAILLAALFLKEYPTRGQALFCVLPIAGTIIITMAGKSLGVISTVGVIFLLLDCLTCGSFKVLNRGISNDYSPIERTFVMVLSCMLVFFTGAMISFRGDLGSMAEQLADGQVLLSAIYLGVMGSVVANLLSNYSARYISVTRASSFSAVNTLTAAVGGAVILGEPVSALAVTGCVLILVGVWQVTRLGS